jgi:hypothetical protein
MKLNMLTTVSGGTAYGTRCGWSRGAAVLHLGSIPESSPNFVSRVEGRRGGIPFSSIREQDVAEEGETFRERKFCQNH